MLKIVGTGAAAFFLATLPFSFDGVTPTVSKAHALIGRPLTPLSVAGLHRRAMRRTYGIGANLGYRGYGYRHGYGYDNGYGYGYDNGYAAPVADLAPPAQAPGYGYAAPGYGYAAPIVAPGGTTVVIVTPGAPAYAAPYAVPPAVVSQPIYAFAPGYGYGYTPGYWNLGYWGGW
jgi:hypothetical protein